jgi:PAS domain S-box-containing protein
VILLRHFALLQANPILTSGLDQFSGGRPRGEIALRESEERFRDFAESASDWFWEMGPDLAFTFGSDRFYEITGWTREEVYGQGREFLVDPELEDLSSEKWRNHFDLLQRHDSFANFEYATRTKKGGHKFISLSGTPFFGTDGVFVGYRGTGTDITEQRRAENALRESEAKYRNIFDNAQVGLVRTRISDGAALDANEREAEILGYESREDFLANYRGISHWHDPDKRAQWISEGIENGFVGETELQLRRTDGSNVWLQTSAIFDIENDHIDTVSVDLTERKRAEDDLRESEQRFRTLADSIPGALAHIDAEENLRFVNKIYADWFGVRPETMVVCEFQ